MASTEQVDDLLEWHPGPSEAATTHPLRAMYWGGRRAGQSKALIGYLWLIYFLLVERGGIGILAALRTTGTWSEKFGVVMRDPSPGSVFEFAAPTAADPVTTLLLESVNGTIWSPFPDFLLLNVFLAGGIIAYLHAPRPAPILAQLGAYSGTYLGRFVRLVVIAGLLFWGLRLLAVGFGIAGADTPASAPAAILLRVVAVFLAVSVDFARVRTVARDSRSMFLETARSLRFTVRNLPQVAALTVLIVLLTVAAGAAVLGISAALRFGLSAALHANVVQQVNVVITLWVQLVAWGAMLSLYQGLAARRLAQA